MNNAKELQVQRVEPRPVDATRNRPVCRPDTDIYETDEAIVVVADLPGLDQSNVTVEYQDDVLTVRGHAPAPPAVQGEPLFREFVDRDFERSFSISAAIDRDRISARMKHGVLTVTLPFAPEVRPKQIAVTSD